MAKASLSKALVWFRNDLRVADNTSLYTACQAHDRVIAYYSLTPSWFEETGLGFKRTERYRARFLLESLHDLKSQLAHLNISLVVQAQPLSALTAFCEEQGITDIYLQEEWTRDETNQESFLPENLNVHRTYDQFLFHPHDVPMLPEEVPEVFTSFRKACEKMCDVRPAVPSPRIMEPDNLLSVVPPIPSLQDLGFEAFETHPSSAFPFAGGATAALERLNDYFWDSQRLTYYKKTRNGLIGTAYSSKFSPWLANGSLSARQIYWAVKDYERDIKKNQSTYWLVFELIWRDYFKFISLKHGADFFKVGGIQRRDYPWKQDRSLFEQWINGETKEPFVNANMLELKKTGFMSNRGRQNVASFLTKQQHIDWRWGAAYFEAMLIDHDVHSNTGNWNYNAGVGNDPRDRVFNIQSQAERYDAKGKYQRMWLQKDLF